MKILRKKYQKIATDFLMNSLAMSGPIIILQFIIYPMLSNKLSNEIFGLILTIIALRNAMSLITGNSLNNVRLIRESEYEENNNSRDYNILLLQSQTFNILLILFLVFIYADTLSISDFFLLFFVFLFASVRVYSTVFYRLKLDYKKIIVLSTVTVLGLLTGSIIYMFIYPSWPVIFFISEFLAIIFVFKSTNILHESKKISNNFYKIRKDFINLFTNATLNNITSYLDRFLINPLIGAEQVAVYYVATIISKTFALIFAPMNNVILSYSAKYKSKINKKILNMYLILIMISSLIQFFLIKMFSGKIISFLYPKLYSLSLSYITVASIGIIIGIAANTIQPLAMTTGNLKWQPRINLIYSFTYLISAIFLTVKFGLFGFCLSTILANVIKFIALYILASKNISQSTTGTYLR